MTEKRIKLTFYIKRGDEIFLSDPAVYDAANLISGQNAAKLMQAALSLLTESFDQDREFNIYTNNMALEIEDVY